MKESLIIFLKLTLEDTLKLVTENNKQYFTGVNSDKNANAEVAEADLEIMVSHK